MCVKVDLFKPLHPKFYLYRRIQRIEYEEVGGEGVGGS